MLNKWRLSLGVCLLAAAAASFTWLFVSRSDSSDVRPESFRVVEKPQTGPPASEQSGSVSRSSRVVAESTPETPAAPASHKSEPPAANGAADVNVVPSPPGPESWATFRNGHRQLGIAATTLPEKPSVLWRFATPDGVVACSAIVGDQVYVPTLSGELISVDRKTGKRQWTYHSVDKIEPNIVPPAFKAAPTVDRDTVYLGDEEGTMHAVDRRNGKLKWRFKTNAEIAGSAALVGDKVIFGSHDFNLYCLKASDGQSGGWKFQTENMVNCSTAIEGDNTFIAGCDTKIRVIDIRKGQEVSEVPLGEGAYLIASPALKGNMLYVGTHDGRVVAVDWQKKQIVWTYTDPDHAVEYRSSAAVTDEFVILGGYDKKLLCLDRKKGTEVWNFLTRGRIESSPVVVGDRVVFGSGDGNMYAVNLKDGKERWRFRAGRSIVASPAVGEKCLVIGTDGPNGTVYCFGSK